ncbi:MAG TPA: NB-ARC domain-containing protein [Halomicronema sp.]
MDVQEVLTWADNLVFTKTGKHLTHVQEAILRGTWQRQKYPEIAKTCHRSEIHVKKEASKLWQLLSKTLNEDINQSNFPYTVERYQGTTISVIGNTSIKISKISADKISADTFYCPKSPQQQPQKDEKLKEETDNIQPKNRQDLTGTPTPTNFYNRTQELTTLKHWILEEKTPLITLLGLSGIGKTALTLQLIQQIQNEFDYIIWKSLENTPTLQTLETNIIEFLSQEQQTKLPTLLIDYLQTYRCLLIFDDLQNIFTPQQLAGHYQPEYENYATFIKKIAQTSHNSCLILITWEKPREITLLETENRPIYTLEINGLDNAQEILEQKNLSPPQDYSKLSELYQGNPLWLNIITATIQELFNSNISEFLSYEDLFLGDIEPLLNQHFQRLTQSEKQLLSWLANQNHPIDISKKPLSLQLTTPEFLKVIQSLNRRCLLQKITDNHRQQYILPPIIKQYIKNHILT